MPSPSTHQPTGARLKPLLLKLAKIILVLLAVGLALRQLVVHWNEVVAFDWDLHIGWLLLSIAAHLFTLLLLSTVWCRLILGFGHTVPLKYGFKIAYISNLARYIPGKIWQVFGMAYFAKRIGIPEHESITSWAVSMIFALSSAFAVAAIGLLAQPELMQAELQRTIGSGVLIGGLVLVVASLALVFVPGPTLAALNLILKPLRRERLEFRLPVRIAAEVVIGYAIAWIAYGFSFWLFVKSIAGGAPLPLLPMIITFIIAYQLGYLAMFSPGGVGIRELVLIGLLSPYLGPAVAGIAVAARLWNLIVEILASLIAWRIPMPDRSQHPGADLPRE